MTRKDPARSQVDVGVLDFAKAFDKVPHGWLLSKLQIYGIDGEVAQWIGAFLNDRTQAVIVDGSTSDQAQVHSGVPQGTVLGPLLFLLFINDLPSVVDPRTEVRLFADDCLIYRSIETTQDQIQFQEDLDALHRWGQSWGMRFNATKCNIMTITNKEDPLTKFYQLDNTILQQVDCATYLGILIHQSLKLGAHTRHRHQVQLTPRIPPKKLEVVSQGTEEDSLPEPGTFLFWVRCRDMGPTPSEGQRSSREDPEQSHPLGIRPTT